MTFLQNKLLAIETGVQIFSIGGSSLIVKISLKGTRENSVYITYALYITKNDTS